MPKLDTFTPLMRASAIGNIGIVEQLLSDGADVNRRGPRGSTALMFAAGSGHLDVVKLLVRSGADLKAKEDGGWTAREHLIEEEDYDLLRFFDELEKT